MTVPPPPAQTDRNESPAPPAIEHPEMLEPLDGAAPQPVPITPEVKRRTAVARDTNMPLDERVEAFEDLVDSEVGDTTFTRARNLERAHDIRQLYLKFEGGNPTGTQKDRIAFAQAMDALRRGFDAITVATCGNYGSAMALAAASAGLRCYVYLPESSHSKRIKEMEAAGAILVRTPGEYERSLDMSRDRAQLDEMYDANPGGANTSIQLRAYGEIAFEIYDELRDAPAVVAVSVSNGTTLAGVYRGFVSLNRRGKTSRIPRFIAGSSHNKNPIVRAFRKKAASCEDLTPFAIRETSVNEPLINWHSVDGDLALAAVRESGGSASNASDKDMLALAREVRELEGFNVLPAATAGLHALLELNRQSALPGDRYVAVLTGRRA